MLKASIRLPRLLCFLCASVLCAASDVGKSWGMERQAYTDPITGYRVVEITAPGKGKADNLYYHFSTFTADNRYLIDEKHRLWQSGRNTYAIVPYSANNTTRPQKFVLASAVDD